MLRMSPHTELRLIHSKRALEHEFENAAPGEIAHEIAVESQRLLSGARFDDYIPVLFHRFAREHLLERVA